MPQNMPELGSHGTHPVQEENGFICILSGLSALSRSSRYRLPGNQLWEINKVVTAYKSLSHVELAFHSLKVIDLRIRPIGATALAS
ncbi:MAG: hypothetical protein WA705_12220 [Candidatus Ozemobacteraceae bacterium]